MLKKLIIVLAACLIPLGQSCIYSESGIYFVEPLQGDPPTIWVASNLDTVVNPMMIDSLEVMYEAEIENGSFYGIETYYLNQLVFKADTTMGSFWINPGYMQLNGVDTLYLYFFFSTNSNSLADILELEWDVISLKYPIKYEGGGGT